MVDMKILKYFLSFENKGKPYLALSLFFFCIHSFAKSYEVINDDGWRVVKKEKGYIIYEKIEKKAGILPLKVTGVINAPLDSIMESLRNVEGQVKWTPDLIIKKTLKDLGPRAAITYSVTDLPWPIYDRSLVLHNELFLDKKRKLLFVVSKTVKFPQTPKTKKTIEAFVGYSNIGFRPINKRKTYVEFTALIDPKGSIPTWIVNFFQQGWPVNFLTSLEKNALKNPKKLRPGLSDMVSQLLDLMKLDQKMFGHLAKQKN